MGGAGRVYLVGAGPGDPCLITVRGLELLRRADVVVHDRLVSPELLDEVRPGTLSIFAGKKPGGGMSQEGINQVLVHHARRGRLVVRLKGGDPFVFGRGGEEAQALAEADIPFEVVPGVSSAVGVPAYAGIPLTHRALASSFAVVTGSEDPDKPAARVDWAALATAVDTLVILMPTRGLSRALEELRAHGRDPGTPVALIGQGTTPTQTAVVASLAAMPAWLDDIVLDPPVLAIVGDVVNLRDQIAWFTGRAGMRAASSRRHDAVVRRRPRRRRATPASPSGANSTTAIRVSPSASM
jgi:uroporphyrinogen III methyltransferase/synthase